MDRAVAANASSVAYFAVEAVEQIWPGIIQADVLDALRPADLAYLQTYVKSNASASSGRSLRSWSGCSTVSAVPPTKVARH